MYVATLTLSFAEEIEASLLKKLEKKAATTTTETTTFSSPSQKCECCSFSASPLVAVCHIALAVWR